MIRKMETSVGPLESYLLWTFSWDYKAPWHDMIVDAHEKIFTKYFGHENLIL